MISYRRIFLWLLFVSLLFVLQTSFLPLFSWYGISANLMLLLTLSWSLLYGPRLGAFMGFMTGLLPGLATGTFLGMDMFAFMIIGYICGAFSRNVFKDQVFLPVMAAVTATFAHYFLVLVLMLLLGYRFNLLSHVLHVLLPMLCFNIVFAYPVHRAACKMQQWTRDRK